MTRASPTSAPPPAVEPCAPSPADLADQVRAAIDADAVADALETDGGARVGPLLSPEACAALAALYDRTDLFRKRIVMARHGFGSGEYQYFADPLPEPVATLQRAAYEALAPAANRLARRLGAASDWPASFEAMRARSDAAGQTAPAPLLLKYQAGDFNCLHQDLYGAVAFPLQLAISLSRPGVDFDGGAFVLVENRPRRQSIASALTPGLGEGVVFPTRDAPRAGAKGWSRAQLRHGVSRVTRGQRMTLGLIFHGAAP